MGHGYKVYFSRRISELSANRRFWGLDKIQASAVWRSIHPRRPTRRSVAQRHLPCASLFDIEHGLNPRA